MVLCRQVLSPLAKTLAEALPEATFDEATAPLPQRLVLGLEYRPIVLVTHVLSATEKLLDAILAALLMDLILG